jgi:hypothetical protein
MEDKELFELFKAGSRAFDEAPSDALWQKIRKRSRRKWYRPEFSRLYLFVLLFLVVAILAICMTIVLFARV